MFERYIKSGSASILVIAGLAVLIAGCQEKTTMVAEQQAGHTPTVPSIDCEVTSGPNKGKRGKRTEDGWCEGDWGGTECRPRSKCKDVESGGPQGAGITPDDAGSAGRVSSGTGNPVVGIRPPFGSAPVEYCLRDGDVLSVVFANTGGMPSPGGTGVIVSFGTDPQTDVTQPMPSIPAGGIVEMAYEIPPGCFDTDCEFAIQWSNQPAVAGRCIG